MYAFIPNIAIQTNQMIMQSVKRDEQNGEATMNACVRTQNGNYAITVMGIGDSNAAFKALKDIVGKDYVVSISCTDKVMRAVVNYEKCYHDTLCIQKRNNKNKAIERSTIRTNQTVGMGSIPFYVGQLILFIIGVVGIYSMLLKSKEE
jgi:hypothetical protein